MRLFALGCLFYVLGCSATQLVLFELSRSHGADVIGYEEVAPGPVQKQWFYATRSCLKPFVADTAMIHPEDITWAVADSLITPPMGIDSVRYYAYGRAVIQDSVALGIVMDREYWDHPEVISHESIHVLTLDLSHMGRIWSCIHEVAGDRFPRRPVTP